MRGPALRGLGLGQAGVAAVGSRGSGDQDDAAVGLGIIATHAVYLSEVIGPNVRSKVLLASQSTTAIVGVGISLLAFFWIPAHWQWFVWVGAAFQVIVLLLARRRTRARWWWAPPGTTSPR